MPDSNNPFRGVLSSSGGTVKTEIPSSPSPSVIAPPTVASTDTANPFRGILSQPTPNTTPIEHTPSGRVEYSNINAPTTPPTKPDLQAEPQPVDENRGDELSDIPANAVKDLGDMMQGVGALGSAAIERIRERTGANDRYSVKQAVNAPITPLPGKSQPVTRERMVQEDVRGAIGVAQDTVTDYYDRYIDPLLKGDGAALGKQLVHHPLNSYLDLAPIWTAPAKVPRLAKQAALATGGRAGAKKAITALDTTQKFISAPGRKIADVAKSKISALDMLGQRASAYNAVRDALRNADIEYRKYLEGTVKEIDRLYKRIPDSVKPYIIEGAEGTNQLGIQFLRSSTIAQDFVNKVDELTNSLTQRLIDEGLMTAEEALKARYGPAFMAVRHRGGAPIRAGELDQFIPQLERFKDRLDKLGVKPSYFGLATKKHVDNFLKHEATSSLADVKSVDKNFLNARKQARINEKQPAREKLREPGVHAEDARDVAVTRILQSARVLHIKEALDELIGDPLFTQQQKGWIKVKLDNILENAAKAGGLDEGALTKFMGNVQKEVILPSESAIGRALQELDDISPPPKLYEQAGRYFKYVTLGPDIFWAAVQFPQNAALYAWHTMKGPQSVANSVLAMMLVGSPRARAIIPKRYLLGENAVAKGIKTLPEDYYLTGGEKWARRAKDLITFKPFRKAIDWNFQAVNAADNLWRMAASIRFMMDELPAIGKAGKLADDVFGNLKDLDNLVNQLEKGFANERLVEKTLKETQRILGDYNKARGTWGKWLTSSWMFWPWIEHSWTATTSIPTRTPLKAALVSGILENAREALQTGEIPDYMKKLGAVPVRASDGTQAQDANGNALIMLKSNITPFLTAMENAEHIATALFGDQIPEDDLADIGLNPLARFMIALFGSVKPGGRGFSDPDMIKYGPGYVKRETMERMLDTGEQPKPDEVIMAPNPIKRGPVGTGSFAIQTLAPREWLLGARIFEALEGGVPSDFTIPFVKHAPKKLEGGKKQKPLPIEEYLTGFGRFAPTQTKYSVDQEEAINQYWTKKGLRRFLYQTRDEE